MALMKALRASLGNFRATMFPVTMSKPVSFMRQRIPGSGVPWMSRRTLAGNTFAPRRRKHLRQHKGNAAIRTGLSTKGGTIVFGSYGFRLISSPGQRLTARQLTVCHDYLRKALKQYKGWVIWPRFNTDISVSVKGNATRMGKGKGPHDHFATRIPVGKLVYEIKAPGITEEKARDILWSAAQFLPGTYEFMRRGELPRVGIIKHYSPSKEVQAAHAVGWPLAYGPCTPEGLVQPLITKVARNAAKSAYKGLDTQEKGSL